MPTSIVTDNHGVPTFHEAVLRERLAAIVGAVSREIGEAVQWESETLIAKLRDVLLTATRKAYADGVRDGFAQGVAAEAALRTEAPR